MIKYNTFLLLFIVSVAAFIFFMIFYFQGIFSFALGADDMYNHHHDRDIFRLFSTIFSPPVIFSGLALIVSSLAVRVLGIICVVKNKMVSDGEKAIWIVGFIIMGFITCIVFLILAKGKKFAE